MKIEWKDVRKAVKYVINRCFIELINRSSVSIENYKPTFTLAEEDRDGYYSMERLFLEHYQDPTEYTFVQDVFDGDIQHWDAMKTSQWIEPYYKKWKKKAEAKLLSEAMNKIVSTAFDESNRNSFQALKYLVERKQKDDTKTKVGRPKKVKEEETVDSKELLADIARLKE